MEGATGKEKAAPGAAFSTKWCGRRDSNSYSLRRWNLNPVCLPISPRPLEAIKANAPDFRKAPFHEYGVDDGNRTHDNWNHNPALYQLSYAHHIASLAQPSESQRSLMARPAGLEPATIRLEGGCSIQLSYGRSVFNFRAEVKKPPPPTACQLHETKQVLAVTCASV